MSAEFFTLPSPLSVFHLVASDVVCIASTLYSSAITFPCFVLATHFRRTVEPSLHSANLTTEGVSETKEMLKISQKVGL